MTSETIVELLNRKLKQLQRRRPSQLLQQQQVQQQHRRLQRLQLQQSRFQLNNQ